MGSFLHQFAATHPMLASSVTIWVVLAAVLNLLLALRSPKQWADMAEANPKIALVLNVLVRAIGPIDLVSIIQHVQAFVDARAAQQIGGGVMKADEAEEITKH